MERQPEETANKCVLNDKYVLDRTLGRGSSCKVKLGRHIKTKKLFALKLFFSDEYNGSAEVEIEALSQLRHPNIIKIFEYGQGVLSHPKKGDFLVNFIVLEFLAQGELFDIVCLSGAFSEATARYFFKQLLHALAYMHSQGITHRDLKPENLLLDDQCDLKVADFGLCGPIVGHDGSGLLKTLCGTQTYMAPELHLKKSYTGESVDLFASAVVLFVMVAQRPCFEEAKINDTLYKLLAANRPDIFWKLHAKGFPDEKDCLSAEFKDLFEKMTVLNRKKRLSLEQVLAHPWLQGQVPERSEIQADFAERRAVLETIAAEKHLRRQERKWAEKQKRNDVRRGCSQAIDGDSSDETLAGEEDEQATNSAVEVCEYGPVMHKLTNFFSTAKPGCLFRKILSLLEQTGVVTQAHQVRAEKLQVKFPVTLHRQDVQSSTEGIVASEGSPKVYICKIQIFRVRPSKHCCDFSYTTEDGVTVNNFDVKNHFNYFKELMADFADATF